MPITLGIDVGTTTITGLALDASSGDVLAVETRVNDAKITRAADKAQGRSEWDAEQIVTRSGECLRSVAGRIASHGSDVVGLGVTGQQHGMLLVDCQLQPLTPLINWQDRRAHDVSDDGRTYLDAALERLGPDAWRRTGCRLAAGYLGATLYWLLQTGRPPGEGTAVFLADYLAARLTGARPITDTTNAAGSGLLNIERRDWDAAALEALDIPLRLLPPVAEAGDLLGKLSGPLADSTGLAPGLPVFVALGDHQASVVGSVADRQRSVLVNVGTGGQVAAYSDRFVTVEGIETRPFPRGGHLLVSAGLCGGRSYAVLEQFVRAVGRQCFGAAADAPLFARLTELAASAAPGAAGLRCVPLFTGTRADPSRRASFGNVDGANFTPANMARSLLEGMARVFHDGFTAIRAAGGSSYDRLVGAGNGLRENAVLARCVAEQFGMPLTLPRHREEAAFGAALVAGVGAGVLPDIAAAGRLVRYDT
jgi:sugar (pentulose or hexulose) kinase